MLIRTLFTISLLTVGLSPLTLSFSQNETWSTYLDSVIIFSSPRAADLNGDGTPDIVIGGGREGRPADKGIVALDGKNGNLLWEVAVRDQIYGSALQIDLSGDGILDMIFCGRSAQLLALNGQNGQKIWEFWPDSMGNPYAQGWFNFYNPCLIPDQDGDGLQDLLATNGGNPRALAADTNRQAGWLLALSSADGAILAQDSMPDGKETYHGPLSLEVQAGRTSVFFGSGGETVGGSFWEVELNDFMLSGLQNAQQLLQNRNKGYIAAPSFADINGDEIYDLLVPGLDERLIALDGATFDPLWEVRFPHTECYVAPTIGQFTGDQTPDAYTTFAIGPWPFYGGFIQVLIDGSSGQVVWQDSSSAYQLSCPNALDMDLDGFDEVLLVDNFDIGWTEIKFRNQLMWLDFNDNTFLPFGGMRLGVNIFSTPLIESFDSDQDLSVIVAYQPRQDIWYSSDGAFVTRIELGLGRRQVAWGAYLGTFSDATYPFNLSVSLEENEFSASVKVYPNPVQQELHIELPEGDKLVQVQIYDVQGRLCIRQADALVDVRFLPAGLYVFEIAGSRGVVKGKLVKE